MNTENQLRQIADRIRYLREILEVSDEELASKINMPIDLYRSYESCEKDIPISMIYEVANVMNVDPTELLTGEEPKMNSYTVTRSGQGVSVERYKGYAFESLAYNFIGRNKEPMIVTMYPNEKKSQLVTHGGQEFNFVIEGKIGVIVGSKTIYLEKGDSLYFDPRVPHGQFAVDGDAKFLTVIDKE